MKRHEICTHVVSTVTMKSSIVKESYIINFSTCNYSIDENEIVDIEIVTDVGYLNNAVSCNKLFFSARKSIFVSLWFHTLFFYNL